MSQKSQLFYFARDRRVRLAISKEDIPYGNKELMG